MINDLVNEHLVADIKRVLHRRRRYVEGLDHKALDEQGDDQGNDDQYRQFAPERSTLRLSRRRGLGVRARLSAGLGRVLAADRTRIGLASTGLARAGRTGHRRILGSGRST